MLSLRFCVCSFWLVVRMNYFHGTPQSWQEVEIIPRIQFSKHSASRYLKYTEYSKNVWVCEILTGQTCLCYYPPSYPQHVWGSPQGLFVHMDPMALHGWNSKTHIISSRSFHWYHLWDTQGSTMFYHFSGNMLLNKSVLPTKVKIEIHSCHHRYEQFILSSFTMMLLCKQSTYWCRMRTGVNATHHSHWKRLKVFLWLEAEQKLSSPARTGIILSSILE